ncbi:unnamed protein product [Arabidopsis thaliana]|uniref:Transmembrane protein n=1 Tax=Arabidopsis thaliana TaxID=3702 RepID=A0A654G127_ARATH|nr:unnamed protein product [Arabidopsis thaliana]VYS66693.1 unnamed protein product [Arabidopsis thaliana]
MLRTKKANTKAETNPVKIPETILITITLEVILDSSGVDDVEVVDKCLTVLLRQLVLVLVLEKKTKKKNKSREIVLLLLHPFLLLLCFIAASTNKRFFKIRHNLRKPRKVKLFKAYIKRHRKV